MAGRNYSSHKFSQVLRKDGTLDVDKLARECSRDVFEDKRHRRVDDVKIHWCFDLPRRKLSRLAQLRAVHPAAWCALV